MTKRGETKNKRLGKWPIEFLPKPKPLTKKQQEFLKEMNKVIEESRKWKRV